jgi:hypothetical protein
MQCSMQTHFEGGAIGDSLCHELASFNIRHFRLSGMNSNLDQCNVMLAEADRAGVNSLLIIKSLDTLSHIKYRNIEWDNEPDGDGRPMLSYDTFMAAYEICQTNFCVLHGPTISNLDRDSLNWLKAFMARGVPKDITITYHHYTPGLLFLQPHQGFANRQEELDELKRIANGRKIACSESGYNDLDELRVAENVEKELDLARMNNLEFWTYYQLNDDVPNGQYFGARRSSFDYSWKPVIEEFG